MNKRSLKSVSALGFVMLVVPAMLADCSKSDNPLASATSGLCCSAFKVGTDMTGADFGVDASIAGQFNVVAQAASDLSAVATASLNDVTNACKNIAIDLGADPNDASVKGTTGNNAVNAWCTLAAKQIKAGFGANGTLAASISVNFTPPQCSASIQANADCQAHCDVSAMCDVKANPPTCMGGTLTVQCSGDCMASAGASIACTGKCTGNCSGSCTADVSGPAVDCKGKCEGTCSAAAMGGTGTGIQADGTCDGQCSGKCTYTDPMAKVSCGGSCDGQCDATCQGSAMAQVKCSGTCSGTATPLKCEGGQLEGGCMANADCSGSCNASANAKADCKPPSVHIVATASATADAQLYAKAITSLETNLPNILVTFKARGQTFLTGLQATATGSANIVLHGDPTKIGVSGAACGILIAGAIEDAVTNFSDSLSAAGKVTASVNIN